MVNFLHSTCILLCLGTSLAFVPPVPRAVNHGISARRPLVSVARSRVSPLRMAADKADILNKVRSIVVQQLAVEESQVTLDASFTKDLGADSLDTVELIMALEEGFDIEIEDEVAAEISSVQDVVNFIASNQS